MPPRISLTQTQINAAVGAELLALCQTLTADGVLTESEVAELNKWLADNSKSDLPAIGFLTTTLQRILADGKVTPEERDELYSAIEKVLPPEARRVAVANRKAVEDALKEARRELSQRNRAVYTVNFMVAGVHYEGRGAVIRRWVQEDDRAFLIRDTENKFSPNAIEVRTKEGFCYGYVPEVYAPEVAPFLDQGLPHVAHVTKVLRDCRVPIPIVEASLHHPDADFEGLTFAHQVPSKRIFDPPKPNPKQSEAPSRSRFWTAAIVFLFVLVLVVKCRS